MEVKLYNINDIPDELLKIAVIAAKYNGRWIFCRHKNRTTWEIPGGHREAGESIEDAARRELYEETGVRDARLAPVAAYGFTDYGLLFYAEAKGICPLPESEIAEIRLFDGLPENLTYPTIQKPLYTYLQGWLNMQNNPDEIWDVYDEKRNLTGRSHRRGDSLPTGDYHIVVQAWIRNSDGDFLLTKRAPGKGYSNMWECTGGSAMAGEDSLTAALREISEETGLTLPPECGKRVITYRRREAFVDVWLFDFDFDLRNVKLHENETCGVMSLPKEDILYMRDKGELVPFPYLDELFGIIDGR